MDDYEFNLISEGSKTENDEFYDQPVNNNPKEIESAYITDIEKDTRNIEREKFLAQKQKDLEEMIYNTEINEEHEFNLASEDGGKTIH